MGCASSLTDSADDDASGLKLSNILAYLGSSQRLDVEGSDTTHSSLADSDDHPPLALDRDGRWCVSHVLCAVPLTSLRQVLRRINESFTK